MTTKAARAGLPMWSWKVVLLAIVLGFILGFAISLAGQPVVDATILSCPTPVCKTASPIIAPVAPVLVRNPVGGIRQIGFLRSESDSAELRPLYGAPSAVRSSRWLYHTVVSGLDVPIISLNRDCTSEIGCEQLTTGDVVEIGGIGQRAVVQLYEEASYARIRR